MTDETPRLAQARRGRSVFWRGKALLSAFDPVERAEKCARDAPVLQRTLYLCPSPLLGYGIDLLLDRMTDDSAVLCVETTGALLDLTRAHFLPASPRASRLKLTGHSDPRSVCAFVRSAFGARTFRRLIVLRLNSGWTVDSLRYDAIEKALRSDLALDWSNAMTLMKLGRRYALNAARNLALLPRSVPLDRRRFSGFTQLVTGAGPSLDAFLEGRSVFPDLSDRSFRIVCVDTALRPLLDRGIVPDLVVALEAQHWNLRDFIGASTRSCPLAMDLSALPSTAAACGGPYSFFFSRWTSLRFFDRLEAARLLPPEIPPLGSVGLAAVELALLLGWGKVCVAGLDFAYAPDSYHARSAPSRDERLRRGSRFAPPIDPAPAYRVRVLRRTGKDGSPLRSDPALLSYRDLFEREYGSNPRLLDVSAGGLELGIAKAAFEGATVGEEAEPTPEASAAGGARADGALWATPSAASVRTFIEGELARLRSLRSALTGTSMQGGTDVAALVDECDYLWAHFPECAAAEGRRPPLSDLSFLKRVRIEIDPFIQGLYV
jgi:hypothetical protein